MRTLTWLIPLAVAALAYGSTVHSAGQAPPDQFVANTWDGETMTDRNQVEEGFELVFNGRDLTGWRERGRGRNPNTWRVENGIMVSRPPNQDLVSTQDYLNFEIKYEYRAYGNSGVGLRGRYEIQIEDSHGRQANPRTDGAIYNQQAVSQNVSRPRGEWQTIHAILVGDRITVDQNGVRTIDNFQLTRPTGINYGDTLEGEAGPIILQGDHGPVDFRNLRVKVLPDDAELPVSLAACCG